MTPFDQCQGESVEFLANRYHAACGDAPGLGKTLTAIRAADAVGSRSNLVVCPASVRSNWRWHVEEHARHPGEWDVVSYNGACDEWVRITLRRGYDVCIPDEAHFCKEPDSLRAGAVFGSVFGVAWRARYIWPLSGTFAPNGRPVEYWVMLKTLHPAFAEMSYGEFTRLYCGLYFNGRENDVRGATRVDEFKALLDRFIISHTKAQAFPGRSAPIVSRVGVALTAAELARVREVERASMTRGATLSPTAQNYSELGDTSTQRRLVGEAMAPHAAQFVREKLEGVRRVVVFYRHTAVGDFLARSLSEFRPVLYRGGMADAQKDAAVRRFGGDPACRLAVLQEQAAGFGINGLQQVCSTAVFAEPDWTPGDTEQRIDRLDRKGAEGEVVNAYILYALGTLSASILKVHDRKDKIRVRLQ